MAAIKLVDVVDQANKLLHACQDMAALEPVTDDNLIQLTQAAQVIRDAVTFFRSLKDVGDKAEDMTNDGLADAIKHKGELMKLIDLAAAPVEQAHELKELFANVSTSLIDAQKSLDESSLKYTAQLDPRLPPTLYGIPNVKAEMRVGFNEIDGKKINLFFFTNTHQKQQYAESVVSFEVVGTPPPPGPAAYGDYVVPIPRLLVLGDVREALLDQIIADKKVSGAPYLNTRDRALVLRYERAGDETINRYLVFWVSQRANQSGSQWHGASVIYATRKILSSGEPQKFEFPNDNNSIFEYPPLNGTLALPPSKLEDFAKDVAEFTAAPEAPVTKLSKLSIDLGDVAMSLSEIVNGWLDSVKYKPQQ